MATNTTTALSAEMGKFYDKLLIERTKPNLVYADYGQKRNIPAGNGKTASFRKYSSLAPASTALTEGTLPAVTALTVTELTASVSQYGAYTDVTDVLNMTAVDNVISDATEILGDQAGLTIDTIVRDVIAAGTNVQYGGGAASAATVAATSYLSSSEIKKAARTLKNNNIAKIDGYYIAVIDPSVSADLMADAEWKAVNQSNNGGANIYKGEIGKLYGVRFIESTNVKTEAGGSEITLHNCLFFGKNSYGVVDVDGSGKPSLIVKQPTDALDQVSTIGWKALFTAKILDQNGIVNVKVSASA